MKNSDISKYLPPVLSEIFEFKYITDTENSELTKLYTEAERILDNQFCDTLDEMGLKRFEKMLSLPSDGDMELRRFKIKTAMGGRIPFTKKSLVLQLNAICGIGNYELSIDYNVQKISVFLNSADNAEAVEKLLHSMAPANMIIEVSRLYRRYISVGNLKHTMLSKFTHSYIKEGGKY